MSRPKFAYFRSERHLRNVAALDCQACGKGGPSQAAHSNEARHGKGRSIRASDLFTAALCPRCHSAVDSSYSMTRLQRQQLWQDAHERTREALIALNQWPEGIP
jgi:hypothetical protein